MEPEMSGKLLLGVTCEPFTWPKKENNKVFYLLTVLYKTALRRPYKKKQSMKEPHYSSPNIFVTYCGFHP